MIGDGWVFDSTNTFCISLETAVDRRTRMQRRFDWFGMDVSFCRAATPEECHENFIDYLSPRQRACTQSHMNIWRHILENEIPYALILEDDAMFDLGWREKMNNLWGELYDTEDELRESEVSKYMAEGGRSEPVDILHGGGGRWDGGWDAVFLNASEPTLPLRQWVDAREQFLCGAYVISLAGVRNLFHTVIGGWFGNVVYMSDWTTSRLQTLGRCWTYFPWLVIQEGRESLIGSGVEADHMKVVRCLGEVGYDISGNYI